MKAKKTMFTFLLRDDSGPIVANLNEITQVFPTDTHLRISSRRIVKPGTRREYPFTGNRNIRSKKGGKVVQVA